MHPTSVRGISPSFRRAILRLTPPDREMLYLLHGLSINLLLLLLSSVLYSPPPPLDHESIPKLNRKSRKQRRARFI